MQLYNDKINIIYDDRKILNIGNLADNMIKGIKIYGLQLLLSFFIIACGIFAILSWKYMPYYQAKLIYAVSKTGDVATDALISSRLSDSFPNMMANTGLTADIKEEMKLKDTDIFPGEIIMYNTSTSNMLNVIFTSHNYTSTNLMMRAFQDIYPTYASKNVGNVELSVIDYSDASQKEMNPYSLMKYIFAGIVFSSIIVIAILFIYAFTRKTIRNESDMNNIVNLDCLAYIPKVKKTRRSNREVRHIMISDKRVSYDFNQAVRSAQSRVEKRLIEGNAKILMVTSSLPEEGKTTFAVNMAQAMSEEGKKIVLVDADLRHPSIANILGKDKYQMGLSDVLEDKVELDKVVNRYNDYLMVISGGTVKEDTALLLSGNKLKEVLECLSNRCDYIIIDTPPAALFTDASLISEYADAGIYLVRQDFVDACYIREGMEAFANSEIRLLGYVLNGVEMGISDHGYHNYSNGKSYRYKKKDQSDTED
ncbi:tyrosine-protein kinase family protein [uncultured Robinsoniella sp.]|uniref:tyrosine-protein kinase family protein n=1 Tax=uncultured Robinsoniella sp. TaxID=904190 RepID=UPI00374F0B42